MPCEKENRVHVSCYPSKGGKAASIIGILLIAVGVLLIILCVPLWAWLAIVGAALILVGLLLVRR